MPLHWSFEGALAFSFSSIICTFRHCSLSKTQLFPLTWVNATFALWLCEKEKGYFFRIITNHAVPLILHCTVHNPEYLITMDELCTVQHLCGMVHTTAAITVLDAILHTWHCELHTVHSYIHSCMFTYIPATTVQWATPMQPQLRWNKTKICIQNTVQKKNECYYLSYVCVLQ